MTNPRNGLIAGGLALIAVIGGAAWYQSEHNSPAASASLYNASSPNSIPNDPNAGFNNPNLNNGQSASYNSGQANYGSTNSGYAGDARYASNSYNSKGDVSSNGYNASRSYQESNLGPNGPYPGTPNGVYQASGTNYNSGYVANDGYSGYNGYNTAPYVSGRYVQSIHRPVRVYYPPARNTVTRETVYEERGPRRVYNNDYVERTTVYDRRHHRSTKKSVAIVAGTAAGGALIGGLAAGGTGAALGALAGGGAGFIYDRMTHNR